MNITFVPYVIVNDKFTVTDDELLSIYNQLKEEKLLDKIFYHTPMDENDFVLYLKTFDNRFFFTIVDNEVIGFSWLNKFECNTARVHQVFFKSGWGDKAEDAAKFGLNYFLHLKDLEGKYILDTLVGITPKPNRLAVKFAEKVGMNIVGEIPNICYLYKHNKTVPGVLSYITR
jgi:hypothetical protein